MLPPKPYLLPDPVTCFHCVHKMPCVLRAWVETGPFRLFFSVEQGHPHQRGEETLVLGMST